jgi:hypothetical protein
MPTRSQHITVDYRQLNGSSHPRLDPVRGDVIPDHRCHRKPCSVGEVHSARQHCQRVLDRLAHEA